MYDIYNRYYHSLENPILDNSENVVENFKCNLKIIIIFHKHYSFIKNILQNCITNMEIIKLYYTNVIHSN